MTDSIISNVLKNISEKTSTDQQISKYLSTKSYRQEKIAFNDPLEITDLEKFFRFFSKESKLVLPQDYLDFLLIHNGGILYSHPEYGGGLELLSLQRIEELYAIYKEFLPVGWYPIAVEEGTEFLFIDSNLCNSASRASNYLFWASIEDINDAPTNLNSNFELWLDRYFASQGNRFWEWMKYPVEYYYR
ncbi:SMI1/KNR4 family protein [Paenibacillus sp. DMB5]|uniref:SMI1/KNR4 family protein n=1 Tax=Paenibacillus sp. DMB5 TaxID=1780103 RepID=UPI0012FF6950|nr:SMI1/KNR4 family protein [Paenibacillus sp. DMB5]